MIPAYGTGLLSMVQFEAGDFAGGPGHSSTQMDRPVWPDSD